MSRNRKRDPDEPVPLNFDHDGEGSFGDHLKPSTGRADQRGDNEAEQYYEEEESLSPEEVKKRKEEGTI